jgi:FkbM family methyltransferase
MRNPKNIIGQLPSYAINRMFEGGLAREKCIALVNFVNSRPNWFQSVDRKILVQTKFGFPIWCDRWDVIGQTIIATGQWEGLLSRTILACLKLGDVAIDIGANMGYDTMLMSTAVGKNGTVLAFEPDLNNLDALLKNIKLLRDNNVIVQSLALSDEPGLVRISLANEHNLGTSNLRPAETGPSQPALATRLDTLLESVGDSHIRLVKMDIEGFEHKAILGMGRLLERIECLTCEISPQFLEQCGTTTQGLFRTLYDHGFESFCAEPNSNGKWMKSDHNYSIHAAHSSHFDALFCRVISEEIRPLIEHAA